MKLKSTYRLLHYVIIGTLIITGSNKTLRGQSPFCYYSSTPIKVISQDYNLTNQKTSAFKSTILLLPLFESYLESNLTDGNLKLYLIDLNNQKVDTITLNFSKAKVKKYNTIKSIAHNTRFITVLTNDGLYSFTINKEKKSSFLSFKKLKYSFTEAFLDDKNVLRLVSCYNFHKKDQKEKCVLQKYQIDKDVILSTKAFKVDGIEFTYFVNKLYDVSPSGNFIIANKNTYHLEIYDSNDKLITQITETSMPWISPKQELLVTIDKENSKSKIEELYNYYNEVNRIEKVFFPNDSLVIVSIKQPKKYDDSRTVEFWERKNNIWEKTFSTLDYKLKGTSLQKVVTPCKAILHELISSSPKIHFINNRLAYVTPFYSPKKFNVTFQKHYTLIREYLQNNPRLFSIELFNLNNTNYEQVSN